MKKTFLFFLINLAVLVIANAQEYKTFKLGFGWGEAFPIPNNNGSILGVFFTIEPAFRVSDDLAIGLRYEVADLIDYDLVGTVFTSYSMNIQYYLSANKFRPFIGAGAGLYRIATDEFYPAAKSEAGFYPRAGFDLGHFNVTLDYNLIATSNGSVYEITDNYLGLRIGLFFWGGKKRIHSDH